MEQRTLVWIFVTMGFLALRLGAQPTPPLVAEGEGFDDLDALLAGISWSSPVRAVTWSAGGNVLATGSEDGVVRFWDPWTGQETRRFRDRGPRDVSALPGFGELLGPIRSIALHPDGEKLAAASDNDVVRLWNFRLDREPARGLSLAWDAEGRRLAVGSTLGAQVFGETGTGRESLVLEGHSREVSTLAWSLDGRLASGSSDRTVRIWDVAQGTSVMLSGHREAVTGIAWSPDGELLASVSSDATLRVWSTADRKEVFQEKTPNPLMAVAWSHDGHTVAAGSESGVIGLWILERDRRFEIAPLNGHRGAVYALAFSPQGERLASGSADGSAKIWDVVTGEEIHRLRAPATRPSALALSPDGRSLVVGSPDDVVHVWSLGENGEVGEHGPETLPRGGRRDLLSIALSADTATVAAGFRDGGIEIWQDGQTLGAAFRHPGPVLALAFSSDGRRLASGTDRSLSVWDLASKEIQAEVESSNVSALAWGAEGQLLTGSLEGEVGLWILEKLEGTTTLTRTLKVDMPSEVRSLTFSTGREAWISLGDGTLHRFNPATGEKREVHRLKDALSAIALSGDGRLVASVSLDQVNRVRLARREGQSYDWTGELVGGEKLWIVCAARGLCWRHDDGSLLLREGPRGELSSVVPAIAADELRVDFVLPPPAKIEIEDGEAFDFALKVRNRGEEPIFFLGLRQRDATGSPWIFHPPPTLASLGPGDTAVLRCHVSGVSAYEMPEPLEAPLFLELVSASGPLRTLDPIEVLLRAPSLSRIEGRLFRDRSFEMTFTNTGFDPLPMAHVLLELTDGGLTLPPEGLPPLGIGESAAVTFHLPEDLELQRELGVRVAAETLQRPIHRWSFEVLAGGWPWRRGWLLLAAFLLAAVTTLAERLLRTAREAAAGQLRERT